MVEVFITNTSESIDQAVKEMFSYFEKSKIPLLKSSNKVYIKVNGIEFQKHSYTSPKVLESVIKYLQWLKAEVCVMENSTQANLTRVVFEITGY